MTRSVIIGGDPAGSIYAIRILREVLVAGWRTSWADRRRRLQVLQ